MSYSLYILRRFSNNLLQKWVPLLMIAHVVPNLENIFLCKDFSTTFASFFCSSNLFHSLWYIIHCKQEKKEQKGPMKSISQTSKISAAKMLFNGSSWCLEIFLTYVGTGHKSSSNIAITKILRPIQTSFWSTLATICVAPKCPSYDDEW